MLSVFRKCLGVRNHIRVIATCNAFTSTREVSKANAICTRIFSKHQQHRYFVGSTPVFPDDKIHFQTLPNGLLIRHNNWTSNLEFPFLWLRDHCRCAACFDSIYLQRKSTVNRDWFTLKPKEINVTDELLSIQWEDDHKSSYDIEWLWENSYDSRCQSKIEPEPQLWDARQLLAMGPPCITYEKLITEVDAAAKVIDNLLRVGVCFITEAPKTIKATETAAESVATIMTSFWGSGVTTVVPDESLELDYAYTNKALLPHCDANYLFEGPGVQIMHVLEPSPEGGETILVDAFNIAAQLEKSNPDAYEILSSTYVNHEYRDKTGKFYRNLDTTFKHHPITKKLTHVRFCPNDLAPLTTIAPSKLRAFYESYVTFKEATLKPENQFVVKLCAGTVVMINNWRVFHGRKAFSGHRLLSTCYLSRAELLSRATLLGVIKNPY